MNNLQEDGSAKKDVQGWLRAAEEWWERGLGSSNQSCVDLAAVEAPKVS
jgi:hypothetical protein